MSSILLAGVTSYENLFHKKSCWKTKNQNQKSKWDKLLAEENERSKATEQQAMM